MNTHPNEHTYIHPTPMRTFERLVLSHITKKIISRKYNTHAKRN
jgi:hypothetical protein